MPGSMGAFDKIRPRDINIEAAISDKKEKLTYFAFKESALNGFSKTISEKRIKRGDKLLFKQEIKTFNKKNKSNII